MNKTTIKDIDVSNKKVLVRVDFNVPLKDGVITDDNRIKEALPTINYLLEKKAKVILFSHLGKINFKDNNKTKSDKEKNNMQFIVERLSTLLNQEVIFSKETVGDNVTSIANKLNAGEVLLLQNTRYESGEEKNDSQLAAAWSELADVFIMDAFGSAHRAHASTYGVPEILNKTGRKTAIGFLVEKEIKALSKCVAGVEKPYIAILGGSKVSDKIKVIEGLLTIADKIIIGGGMAYTFLKALGHEIGNSLVETSQLDFAKMCLQSSANKIILPIDHIIANDFSNPTIIKNTPSIDIEDGFMGLDIGERTRKYYIELLAGAKIIFWNGPMGVFENKAFSAGTIAVCEGITTVDSAFTVIGGGDSAAAAAIFGFKDKFDHVSTGGGASLEMIENNGKLPGIDIIS